MKKEKKISENNLDDQEFVPETEDIAEDIDIENIEESNALKLKQLRKKLKACEVEKMQYLEDLQRAKAEFLNAKKRFQEGQSREQERATENHIEKILPLADSFHMAMNNKEAWEKVDEQWRKGIESIHAQLHNILDSYNISEVNPQGEDFDPNRHEAITNVPVDNKSMHHKIISVIQNGFVRTVGDAETLIRPARVTVGEYSE